MKPMGPKEAALRAAREAAAELPAGKPARLAAGAAAIDDAAARKAPKGPVRKAAVNKDGLILAGEAGPEMLALPKRPLRAKTDAKGRVKPAAAHKARVMRKRRAAKKAQAPTA